MTAHPRSFRSTRSPQRHRPKRQRSPRTAALQPMAAKSDAVAVAASRNRSGDRLAAPAVLPFPKVKTLPAGNAAVLNRSHPFPVWLRLLMGMQQGSTAIAFCLATLALSIYASTVYLQQQWSNEYEQLQALQREQRNLMAVDAMVENQLAQQAQRPDSGLVAPSPANTIFLPKSSEQQPMAQSVSVTAAPQAAAQRPPLGY